MLKIDLNFIICIVAAGMWIRLMILDIIYHEIFNINDVVFFYCYFNSIMYGYNNKKDRK